MVHASRTIKVNADLKEPRLTRSLVWRGLMMKAENPLPFVPVITSCKVVERSPDRPHRGRSSTRAIPSPKS